MKTKIAAVAFLGFILLVILAADTGRMPAFVRTLYQFKNGDRVGHVVLYGILALLLGAAFPRMALVGRLSLPIVTIALWLFAATEECSQALFATRTADLTDLACSCIGIAAGAWVAWRWRRQLASRTQREGGAS